MRSAHHPDGAQSAPYSRVTEISRAGGRPSARGQALRALGAQVAAETRSRLRSTGTILTVLAMFALAFLYIPPPGSRRVSILWQVGEGANAHTYSGTYSAGFIGAVVALLTSMLMPLAGFYLVAGSVRRDLERRVWPIIAATRTSPTVYLLGKWLASFAYLLVLAALALLPAIFLFLRYGTGPFSLEPAAAAVAAVGAGGDGTHRGHGAALRRHARALGPRRLRALVLRLLVPVHDDPRRSERAFGPGPEQRRRRRATTLPASSSSRI